MSMIFIFFERRPFVDYIKKAPGTLFILCFIILCVVRYLLLEYINPNNTISANITWFIGVVCLGFMAVVLTYFGRKEPLNLLASSSDILFILGFYSIVLLIIVSLMMHYIPYLQTINWSIYGVILIYTYIVALIVGAVYITDSNNMINFITKMMYISIIIFIIIIAYNHVNLMENSEKCGKSKELMYPDYPSETFNFIYMLRRLFFEIFYLPSIKQC